MGVQVLRSILINFNSKLFTYVLYHSSTGLYVVGGPVVNRRHRSPERRSKTSKNSRSQTAYSTPSTFKNGRPRTIVASNLSPQHKPSPSSIPSSSIPPSLPNIGGGVAVGHNSWAFSVKGVPKEIHGNDTAEQSPSAPPLSAPPVHSKRKGVEFLKQDAPNTQQIQPRTNSSFLQTYGGQFHLDAHSRVKSAPNMGEIQNLNITTVGLTTRSLNGGSIMIPEQQHTQRYTLPSPSQMFDEPKRVDGNRSSDEFQTDAFQPLQQSPRNRLPKTRQSGKPPLSNFENKLMRIRNIMDKSPEYDGPIRYSPSELRPSLQVGSSGFDNLLIMRQMPRQQRHQRSPRAGDSPEENPNSKCPADTATSDTNQYGNQRERSMIMELNQLSRKHAAAKSTRSTDSKEATRSQTAALQVTSSATVPNEELPKETLVNDWLDEPDKHKKKIVCNVPNAESTS